MRYQWEGVHESLVNFLFTVHAEAEFAPLRSSESMRAFATPLALLDHLTERSRDLEETDRIYAALVRAVQAGEGARVAQALLLCGLWPGLDRLYRRSLRQFRGPLDDVASVILAEFTALVRSLDLHSVTRVAASLVRSTGREALSSFRREWAKRSRFVERIEQDELAGRRTAALRSADGDGEGDDGEDEDEARLAAARSVDAAPDTVVAGATFWLELVDLRRGLIPLLGENTDLVLRVVVLEEPQRKIAADMGIGVAATRKRFQRARRQLHRLRDDIQGR